MANPLDVRTENSDIVLTRRFDAPRALVFMAWVDPAMMSAWWGPRLYPTTAVMDAQEGGAFTLTMHGPDGGDYPIVGRFGEIVPNEKVVLIMDTREEPAGWHEAVKAGFVAVGGAPEDYGPHEIETEVLFADDGEGTLMTVRQRFASVTMRDAHIQLGSAIGWGESFEKLDEVLAKQA